VTCPMAVGWWGVERRFFVPCRRVSRSMRRNNTNRFVSLGSAWNQIPNRASPPLCGPYREVELPVPWLRGGGALNDDSSYHVVEFPFRCVQIIPTRPIRSVRPGTRSPIEHLGPCVVPTERWHDRSHGCGVVGRRRTILRTMSSSCPFDASK